MKRHLASLLLLVPAACGSSATEITLTVSGVQMSDLEGIRGDLARLKGVSEVRPGQLREGRATFSLRYSGKGPELAADLSRLGSGLKNVTGFDPTSVQVSWTGAPAAAAAASKGQDPAPAVPAAATPDGPKAEKDPLAYRIHQLPAGTVATFDGWKINPLPADANWAMMETHPEGKENDFQLIVAAGTPEAQVQANLFEEGARYLRQLIPAMRPSGEARSTSFGGDEARVQDYVLEAQGKKINVQSVIIKKKDVAVALLAFGTEAGWKEYGRSVMITAQSITIKESPPDPALVGTWVLDNSYSSGTGTSNAFSYSSSRSVTIYPNGTFTESSFSSAGLNNTAGSTSAYLEGGDRGRVVKRGNVLTFQYDNGKVWSPKYSLDGGGKALVLNGKAWFRQ
jgi:hypothetical protein